MPFINSILLQSDIPNSTIKYVAVIIVMLDYSSKFWGAGAIDLGPTTSCCQDSSREVGREYYYFNTKVGTKYPK